jgi:hypothetical protein
MRMKKLIAFLIALPLITALAAGQCIIPAQTANVQTASYSALAADAGKMILMNCASTCTP